MRLAQKVLFFLIVFMGLNGQAAVTITGVTGASNFIAASGKIFGGSAGNCTAGVNDVCDSCINTGFTAPCNKRRIHTALEMVISIKSGIAGHVILTNEAGTAANVDAVGSTTTSPEQIGTLRIAWGFLCDGLDIPIDAGGVDLGNCGYNGTGSFRIGIDKDGNGQLGTTGDESLNFQIRLQNTIGSLNVHIEGCVDALSTDPLCGFGVLPGDEKAIVVSDQLRYIDGYPNGTGGIKYTNARLYFAEGNSTFNAGDFALITREQFADLATSGSGADVNLDTDTITGLVNGSRYYFLLSTVDEANNEGFYSDINTLGIQHTAVPNEVFGLLSGDLQCFVATAAYGSPMMKEVVTLRRFRGYLLQNYRALSFPFIKLYYKVSPPLAEFISRHETLRSLSRIILWPAVVFAKSSLIRGLPLTLLISILPFLLLGFFIRRMRR